MNLGRLASRAVALAAAAFLLLFLGVHLDLVGVAVGVALVAIGWLLHDSTPPAAP